MKKILVFSTNYLPHIGGAELAIKEIAARMPDGDFSLITARLDRSLPVFETLGKISVYRVGFGFALDKFLLPISGFLKARSLHKKEKFLILWSMMASQASVAAAFFKITHRHIPLVLTLQEGDEEDHLRRYVFNIDWLYRLIIRPWHALIFHVADLITVISKHLEMRAREFSLATPVVVVPNGVDINFFSKKAGPEERARIRKQFGITPSDFLAITVSRLVEKNRVEDCIKAIHLLPPQTKLFIVGTGLLEKNLKSLVGELQLEDRVLFVGEVSPEKVPEYLAAADVFVRPSSSEGFGSAFIEAMAARIPVIATPIGGIADFLQDKRTGLLTGVRDPKDLALKIGVVMRDQDLRLSLIEEAERMVKERYDWSIIAARMNEKVFKPLENLKRERILIATGIFPPDIGGPALYAKHLSETFRGAGHQTSVVSFSRHRLPSGLRHIAFSFRLLIPMLMSDWVLALDTVSVGFSSVILGKLFRKKVVVRIGGDFLWEQYVERTGNLIPLLKFYPLPSDLSIKEKLILFLTKLVTRFAGKLTFNTGWQKDIWDKPYRLKSSRASVVENYLGEKQETIVTHEPEEKVFLWAGRSIKLKNVPMLKKAFASAKKTCPEIRLEVANFPHEALLRRLKDVYAVVLPSISEVNPNFILEAVHAGKPFISTKHTGLYKRLKECGIWVDPLDENEIAGAFCTLANSNVYRSYLEKLSHAHVTRDWSDVSGDYVRIFKSL